MSGALGELTSPELGGLEPVLLVPIGSCEQHGPHLPLDTDTRVATAIAYAAADRLDALVAPPIGVGASGEHDGFRGTLSIGQAALALVIVELRRSADAFGGVVLVNAHGGNAAALAGAVGQLILEQRPTLLWHAHVPGGDAHAGRTETSLMLAVAPTLVRLDRATAGVTEPLETLLPRLRRHGVRDVSPNGVLGDPTGASSAEGGRLLAGLVDDLVRSVVTWRR